MCFRRGGLWAKIKLLILVEESEVHVETEHSGHDKETKEGWTALAVFAGPERAQEIHHVAVEAEEEAENAEAAFLFLSLFLRWELAATLHLEGMHAAAFHLQIVLDSSGCGGMFLLVPLSDAIIVFVHIYLDLFYLIF